MPRRAAELGWWKLSRRRAAARKIRLMAGKAALWLGFITVTASVIMGIRWWQDGTISLAVEEAEVAYNNLLEKTSYSTDMVVRQVVVEGRHHTPLAELEDAADISEGDPMLGLDLASTKKRLEQISWIDSAEIYRNLPGTIRICIKERAPVALLQEKGKLSLIDRTGRRIEQDDISEYSYLPVVSGDGAAENAYQLVAMLADTPELLGRIASAVRVGERRWNVRFYNGVEVMLPEKNAAVAWEKFAHMQKEHNILAKAILQVDLRQSGRAYLRMAKGAVPAIVEGKGGDSI